MAAPALTARQLSAGRAVVLPCAFALVLAGMALLPPVNRNVHLIRAYLGACAALLLWAGTLYVAAKRTGRPLTIDASVRRQHWVQACAQTAILVYWGWYWDSVYAFAPLILAQIVFAYGVDSLMSWSRRDTYVFTFGPFPVVLSINLFLWFKPEWFYWQFAMIAVGYAAKELIRWNRDGRSTHIFNPSSFPLGVASLVLILAAATETTWGVEIATTQFFPPHMYVFIFLVSLPGQLLFGVATMTLAAVVTVVAFGVVYLALTGTYFFYDSYIPVAVFLGMHLLFTDPSTSPRTEAGRLVFGVLYGLGTIGFFALLSASGVPTFYDKLLPVPLLNLMVRGIDRIVASRPFVRFDPVKVGRALTPARRRFAYTALWAGIFLLFSGGGALGDDHPGQWMPFWQEACAEGRGRACAYLTAMQLNYCFQGSGWACNELGIQQARYWRNQRAAGTAFDRSCSLGFQPGCENGAAAAASAGYARAAPPVEELPIVLRGSKGPVEERDPATLYAMACRRGWPDTCRDRTAGTVP